MTTFKRLKNILDKDYTSKSKIQSGYRKQNVIHNEGDIWVENDKTWIIRNGIKQSISKFDTVRQAIQMPLTCPKCNQLLKTRNDKKFYRLRKKCMNCIIEEDTQRMIDGTFDEYERKIITENSKTWLSNLEQLLVEYIDSRDDEKIMTEDGQIEEWGKGYSKDKLKEVFAEQIDKIKEELDDYSKVGIKDEKK